jgi:hypothetical protein
MEGLCRICEGEGETRAWLRKAQSFCLQRNTEEVVRGRVEISYSPKFTIREVDRAGNNLTAVPVSLYTRRYI